MNGGEASGPAAALWGPVTAGRMIGPTSAVPIDLDARGYVQEEFFVTGTASAFESSGPLPSDGRWSVHPVASAPYRTRIVVRRPARPERFNGTVLVEWFNVTGGLEAGPDWTYLAPQIVSDGYVYVGVSAQAFGVNGGEARIGVPGMAAGRGLVATEPERYATLSHPGDRFAFDMFSQIGRALRAPADTAALGPLRPRRLVAMGESQSAFFLTTYVDAVQPWARAYDGFFVHSRGGSGASPTGVPIAGDDVPKGLVIRSDTSVPVFVFETETDLGPMLDYVPARQPDTDRIRTWEVAGTAHGDAYVVGRFASLLGCGVAVNEGPQHFVAQAALVALNRWITDGTPPPRAPHCSWRSPIPPGSPATGSATLSGVSGPRWSTCPSPRSAGTPCPVPAGCARCSGRRCPSTPPPSSISTATGRATWQPSSSAWTRSSAPGSSSAPTAPSSWNRRGEFRSPPEPRSPEGRSHSFDGHRVT